MQITFAKDHTPYKLGETATVSDEIGRRFIWLGAATETKAPAVTPADRKPIRTKMIKK